MKNNTAKGNSTKNLSLQRRMTFYYKRALLVLKIIIISFVALFFFTNVLDNYKAILHKKISHFLANYGFVLENLVIEGQKNSSLQDIIDIVNADKGTPIYDVGIDSVKTKLENNIWIKGALVERRLPSTLYIAVVEREPIAIWQFEQKLYLIDTEGNRISLYSGQNIGDLIQVIGQDANIYAQSLTNDLIVYPGLAEKVKSAVRYGQRRWNLIFKEGITVKMPEQGFEKAYDFLNSLDKQGKLFGNAYKMLDLRDANKYYFEKVDNKEN